MKNFLVMVLLVFAAQNAWAQDNGTPDEYAERVQDFYKATSDFQSKFVQTYTDLAAGDQKVSFGRVYFKKPGKMRWDYLVDQNSSKREKVYVSDGDAFWIYETEFQQVFKQCLAESQLPTSLRFLMGEGDLLAEFNITFAKGSTEKAPKLRLVPKVPTSRYKELQFEVNPTTYQVVKTTIFDPYGNTNEIKFDAALVNKNLPDSGFVFKTPKGAREINPQKTCQ